MTIRALSTALLFAGTCVLAAEPTRAHTGAHSRTASLPAHTAALPRATPAGSALSSLTAPTSLAGPVSVRLPHRPAPGAHGPAPATHEAATEHHASSPRPTATPATVDQATVSGSVPQAADDDDPPANGASDSTAVLEESRRAQRRFERVRVRHLPRTWSSGSGPCDERVGMMCFWHDDDNDWDPEPEAPEIIRARDELLDTLRWAGEALPGDGWIVGQRVHYLVEAGRAHEAIGVARDCRALEPGWCDALRGLALHTLGRYEDAERSYRAALAAMDSVDAAAWADPGPLLGREDRSWWDDLDAEARRTQAPRIWVLADPYYLVRGNDRWTAHLGRHTTGRVLSRARNPHGVSFSAGLDELAVRYGHEVSWLRTIRPAGGDPGATSVVGRHAPRTERYLSPDGLLADSTLGAPARWGVGVEKPASAYAPSYAPRLVELEAQLARFRRGDSLSLLAAFRLVAGDGRATLDGDGSGDAPASGEVPPDPTDLQAGLFLHDAASLGRAPAAATARVFGSETARLSATVPLGVYLVALEALDGAEGRGGRVRGGIGLDSYLEDVPVLSDLWIVDARDSLPATLDGALQRGVPSVALHALGAHGVAWEMYGLGPGDVEVRFRLRVERDGVSILRRAGQWLRLMDRDEPLVVQWSEPGPGRRGPHFRAVDLDLRNLHRGMYTLRLEADLPGRSSIVATRRIEIVD